MVEFLLPFVLFTAGLLSGYVVGRIHELIRGDMARRRQEHKERVLDPEASGISRPKRTK